MATPAASKGGLPVFARLIANIERVVLGKRQAIELLVVALAARGHALIEDVPGVAKTMLARALAMSIEGDFRRVQCTPDLLPSEVVGVTVYNPKDLSFAFRRGPVFCNVLLADEVNRATPRTQSAFLEAMEEKQVSMDGITYPLPRPFFLVATQNPIDLAGTFPLPEAQLDRFLLRLSIGYPSDGVEVQMLKAQQQLHPIGQLKAVMDIPHLLAAQDAIRKVFVHDSVLEYVQRLAGATRQHPHAQFGASPRGALALMRAAQALAVIRLSSVVLPDHVKSVAHSVLDHRIVVKPRSRVQGIDGTRIVEEVLQQVEVPLDYAPQAHSSA
jgi:MoxR-like ATPase